MKKKLLLIKFSSLGDVIAFTPVIGYINTSSEYEIHHWVMDDCKIITENNPKISKIYSLLFNKNNKLKTFFSLIKNIIKLRSNNYEYIFLFHRSSLLKFICLLIKSKYRYGYKVNNISDFFFNFNIEYDIYKNRSIQEIELTKSAKLSFFNADIKLEFFFPTNFSHNLKIPFEKYIVINSGGGNKISDARNRLWPIEKYLNLINSINYNVILVGQGHSDYIRSKYIVEKSINRNLFNFVNKTNFLETASIIKGAKLYVGNDSGLIFLSTALNVPNIGIYGPTPVSSATPYGNKTFPIKSDFPCAPCYNPKDGINGLMYRCQKNICMHVISVEEVLNSINFQLSKNEY